jgi:transposase
MAEQVSRCRNCGELLRQLERMELRMVGLLAQLTKAETRVRQLQEQLAGRSKDSTNSSKPPSSDIVKPPKQPSGPRRRGAQVGHAPQQRPPFTPDQIDAVQRHEHASCPQCGGPVETLPTPAQVIQQVELVAKPTVVTEHQSCTCRCPTCRQEFTQPIPPQIAGAGTFGPRFTAWVAYLKGACHASFGTIQQLLREGYGLRIATGTLARLCHRVSRSLQTSYDDLRRQIPAQASLHIDETSHRENGQGQWTWVFRAPQFTLFHIDPTRSAAVLEQVLGSEFSGTLLADYYAAYRAYLASHPRADAQFCLAHLVRDVKFLETLPDEADRRFGGELLAELKALFRLWHTSGEHRGEAAFRAALVTQGQQLHRVATEQAPDTQASETLARRFRKHGDQYLRFTRVPGLEPTNNAAEQAIRQVVIDRRVTQGTRSPRGRDWCQRIWTTIATCRQHSRDLLSFLEQSFLALLTDTPPPSLLPAIETNQPPVTHTPVLA